MKRWNKAIHQFPGSTEKTSYSANRVSLPRALSKLGYASRTQAIALIREGRVAVNGRTEQNPHRWVSLATDFITIDGTKASQREFRYLLFHKPVGVTTTRSDERGSLTVYDLLGEDARGLSPVGRLDKETSGFLLFTNDHQLAHALTDPEAHVPKIYRVVLTSSLTAAHAAELATGIVITVDGKPYKTRPARVVRRGDRCVDITLWEGKNRQVRKMFMALGYTVEALHRLQVGPLSLGSLKEGASRLLKADEVRLLREVLARKTRT